MFSSDKPSKKEFFVAANNNEQPNENKPVPADKAWYQSDQFKITITAAAIGAVVLFTNSLLNKKTDQPAPQTITHIEGNGSQINIGDHQSGSINIQ
jgi:hypothetical protein